MDEVSWELLKTNGEDPSGAKELLKWFNPLLNEGHVPRDWLESIMILLPKESCPDNPRKTRPISMSSATEKLFCRMVFPVQGQADATEAVAMQRCGATVS